MSRERAPTILVRNKELNLPLRNIIEDYFNQILASVKETQKDKDDWLFSYLKLLETMIHSIIEKAINKQLSQLSDYENSLSECLESAPRSVKD